jgi:hypothetical protein
LPNVEFVSSRVRRVLDVDSEHFREVLSEAVRGSSLDTSTGSRDETFDSSSVETSGELLLLRFDTGNDGDCEEFFVNSSVEIEDLENFFVGFLFREECGVTFLPEELSGSKERFCRAAKTCQLVSPGGIEREETNEGS